MTTNYTQHPIVPAVLTAVPLYIAQLLELPQTELWRTIVAWTSDAAAVLNEVGEGVLYRTQPGDSARGLNAVAKAIAALSFCPGGITLFGYHWEAKYGDTPLLPEHMGVQEIV